MCLLLWDEAKAIVCLTVTYRQTGAHTPDPCAPRLSGGLVNSGVCLSPPPIFEEGRQREEREADEKKITVTKQRRSDRWRKNDDRSSSTSS